MSAMLQSSMASSKRRKLMSAAARFPDVSANGTNWPSRQRNGNVLNNKREMKPKVIWVQKDRKKQCFALTVVYCGRFQIQSAAVRTVLRE